MTIQAQLEQTLVQARQERSAAEQTYNSNIDPNAHITKVRKLQCLIELVNDIERALIPFTNKRGDSAEYLKGV